MDAALKGEIRKIGEAEWGVEPKTNAAGTKIYFGIGGKRKSGYAMGIVTYDVKADKWYGSPKLVAMVRKAYEL